jgi:ABC-type dipeptide/oligopeptide/nickel transport system permease component
VRGPPVRRADFVIKRTGYAIVTVFVAITLNFFLFRVLPGDAVSGLRCQSCTPQFKASIRAQYGLDKPKLEQYFIYLDRLAHGDLGTSVYDNQPVWDDIKTPLLNTLPMVAIGTLVSILFGVAAGILSAWRRGTAVDKASLWTSLAFYAMPTQWIGLLVIFYVAAHVGLPLAGISDPTLTILGPVSTWTFLQDRAEHLFLPALTLGIGLYGEYALIVRSAMLETLGEDYVLTARAKGLSNWGIIRKHGLRNAMLPVVTLIALSLGAIVAGAIVVEDVFSYPGIGLATVDAINHRDWPVLEGIFLLLTVAVIVCNFIADLLYFKLDPRVTS